MAHIDRELSQVWDALRRSKGERDDALVEVRVTNLRGIEYERFPFDYPVSVLAGPNGSGKSTVLFACACAYQASGRSRQLVPSRLFPDFKSRQADLRSDTPQQTELEFHYLHGGERRFCTWRRTESWTRQRDGQPQPEREVYLRTLANLASPAEVRGILKLGLKEEVRAEPISPELLLLAHRILPWRYQSLDLVSAQSPRDLLLAKIKDPEETRYSEFHMSSGERTIVRISKDISGLTNALVLIDEVESGLHPYTQQQAMLELQRSALRQKLQIIVASHSPVILDSVPPEGRIFLDRDPSTGHVRRVPLYRDIFQKALYGQSRDQLSILCEDEVAEGVIRGVLDELNVQVGMRPEDVLVGRNTGVKEFPSHIQMLGKFGKLSDFAVVLDGDARSMEAKLKAVAEEFGHTLRPLFLPGEASPEHWLWEEILRKRPQDYASIFGLAVDDMKSMTNKLASLTEGAVQQGSGSKAALRAFAEETRRTVPDIARSVARQEADKGKIPELLQGLSEEIERWRGF